MVDRPLLAVALAVLMAMGLAGPASSQATKTSAARASLDPGASSTPDPLTPPEVEKPAPAAPGAPATPAEATPAEKTDPVVALVRQRLGTPPARASAADRDDLAGLAAFYAEHTAGPVWTDADGRFNGRAQQAMAEIRKADDWGLKASAFDLPTLPDPPASPEALADAEIRLGLAVLRYGRHARGGRLDPPSISRILDRKPVIYDPKTLMQAAAAASAIDAYLRDLHPKHPQFQHLRQALLAARAAPGPGGDSIQRLIVNMERWRWMPQDLGSFYVWDSVTEQITTVYKDGKPILTEKIVVGKPGSPTPFFSADMLLVIFHPSWGVPPGMKVHELLPQLKKAGGGWFFFGGGASSVLKAHDLILSRGGRPIDPDSVDWNNVDIRSFDFTQPPGPRNLLGIVKFRFPNKHDVYMHDTPERHLFNGPSRTFSHGCMRVQNPVRLAEVLLAHDKGWGADKVAEYVRRGGEVKLTTPIPVHVAYFTAIADDAGKINYRADIYGLDGRIATALEGRSVHIVSAAGGAREPAAKAAASKPEAAKADPAEPAKKRVRSKRAEKKRAAQTSTFNPFAER
jgi:murein L,D-transpeptidase YcbB/YkuD